MKRTAAADMLLKSLTAFEGGPLDTQRWLEVVDFAERLARKDGKNQVAKKHVEAAVFCAGEEFIDNDG